MDLTLFTHPTAGGLAGAVGAVVAGAPLFSDGLRALRLRRRLRRLRAVSAAAGDGFRHLQGTVALESPLFAPLSARPCAAFRLELRADGAPIARTVGDERAFRVVTGDGVAHVEADGACWALPRTAEREVVAGEPLSGTLARLLERAPEVLVWRRAGGRLRLVERALAAGSACHVVGHVQEVRAAAPPLAAETVLLRTGTDDVPETMSFEPAEAGPELWVGPDGLVDFTFVSDREPAAADLAVPPWRALGLLAGPALTLFGLLYLAAAADALRAVGRF
jgi:hypothetical protein